MKGGGVELIEKITSWLENPIRISLTTLPRDDVSI